MNCLRQIFHDGLICTITGVALLAFITGGFAGAEFATQNVILWALAGIWLYLFAAANGGRNGA